MALSAISSIADSGMPTSDRYCGTWMSTASCFMASTERAAASRTDRPWMFSPMATAISEK